MPRTICYAASLSWIMILFQNCHSDHKFNIDPLEVSFSTFMPRVAAQEDKRVVLLPPHAAVGQHPSSNSVSSLISAQSSQQEPVKSTHAKASLHEPVQTFRTALGPSLVNTQDSFSLFSTLTDEEATFKQEEGNTWYVEMPQRVLPAQNQTTEGTYLRWLCSEGLCSQDHYVSRARVHIIRTTNGPQGRFVYLGHASPLDGPPTTQDEQWKPGPTIVLDSNETRTEVYHILQGCRYIGYCIQPDLAIDRANCTITYIKANSCEALEELKHFDDDQALEERLRADTFDNAVNLDAVEVEVEGQSVRVKEQQGIHISTSCWLHCVCNEYSYTD